MLRRKEFRIQSGKLWLTISNQSRLKSSEMAGSPFTTGGKKPPVSAIC
jgi:hypothetical protein